MPVTYGRLLSTAEKGAMTWVRVRDSVGIRVGVRAGFGF